MLILPAIDLLGGKCVRLAQGDYGREKVYGDDPVALAEQFQAQGGDVLHVVDLDGAKTGEPLNLASIERIAKAMSIPVEVGGGVRTLEAARRLLDLGVARVVMGTTLVRDPDGAAKIFAALGEQVVAGIDARNGKVAVSGWTEQSEVTALDLAARMQQAGARRVILTDIARDGMLSGPNLQLLEEVAGGLAIPVIQSGGIGTLDHVRSLVGTRAEGVIIGRALYEGKFTVREAVAESK